MVGILVEPYRTRFMWLLPAEPCGPQNVSVEQVEPQIQVMSVTPVEPYRTGAVFVIPIEWELC